MKSERENRKIVCSYEIIMHQVHNLIRKIWKGLTDDIKNYIRQIQKCNFITIKQNIYSSPDYPNTWTSSFLSSIIYEVPLVKR